MELRSERFTEFCSQHASLYSSDLSPSGLTDWSGQPAFIQQAIAVKERNEAAILAIPGVIGDGVGLSKTNPNAAEIIVFTSKANVAGIPESFEALLLCTETKEWSVTLPPHSFTTRRLPAARFHAAYRSVRTTNARPARSRRDCQHVAHQKRHIHVWRHDDGL